MGVRPSKQQRPHAHDEEAEDNEEQGDSEWNESHYPPELAPAFQLVSPQLLSAYAPFWQEALPTLSSALAAHSANDIEQFITDACQHFIRNSAQQQQQHAGGSNNLASMVTVLCMSLEQYAAVQRRNHAQWVAEQQMQRENGTIGPNGVHGAPPPILPPLEPIHVMFSRLYRPFSSELAEAAHPPPDTAPLPPPIARQLPALTPPAWLLDLITLLRIFFQYLLSELEYKPQGAKVQLMSLTSCKRKERTDQQLQQSPPHPAHSHPYPQPVMPPSSSPNAAAHAAPNLDEIPLHSDLSYRLVHAILTALSDIPLSSANEELHVELSGLLLILFSAQIYVPMNAHYQAANIYLAHALCGPFARAGAGSAAKDRVSKFMQKMVENMLYPLRQKSSLVNHGASPRHESPSAARDAASYPVPIHPPSHVASANPPTNAAAAPSTLAKRFAHIGMSATSSSAAPLLRRIGSRLYSLLLLPVHLFKRYLSGLRGEVWHEHAHSASSVSMAYLVSDSLAMRCNFLFLLLAHEKVHLLRSGVGEDGSLEPIQDERGNWSMVEYRHAEASEEFDWRKWRDAEEEVEKAATTKHVHWQQQSPHASTTAAHESSIRSTAPPVHLPSLHTQQPAALDPTATPVDADIASQFRDPNANPYAVAVSLLCDEADVVADEFASLTHSTPPPVERHLFPLVFSPTPSPSSRAAASYTAVNFPLIYQLLSTSLPSEPATLLLYTLLHSNARFKEFVLAKFDVDRIVLPIVQALYDEYNTGGAAVSSAMQILTLSSHASASFTRNRVYMLLILLLLLSEDRGFVEHAHRRVMLKSVQWYRDSAHALQDISLGSLVMLVLLKVAAVNYLAGVNATTGASGGGGGGGSASRRDEDAYVASNCMAILSNLVHNHQDAFSGNEAASSVVSAIPTSTLSPSAILKLHSSVVMKLLALLSSMGKRFQKVEHRIVAEARTKMVAQAARENAQQQASVRATPASAAASVIDPTRINLAPPSSSPLVPQPVRPAVAASSSPISNTTTAASLDFVTFPPSPALLAQLTSCLRFSSLLFELVLAALATPKLLEQNVSLLYSMVQSSDNVTRPFLLVAEGDSPMHALFQPLNEWVELQEHLQPLAKLCATAESMLEQAAMQQGNRTPLASSAAAAVSLSSHTSQPLSVEASMRLLQSESRPLLHAATLSTFSLPPQSYSYEEQPHSEHFFLPFLWECAFRAQLIRGSLQRIVMFNTGGQEQEYYEEEEEGTETMYEDEEQQQQREIQYLDEYESNSSVEPALLHSFAPAAHPPSSAPSSHSSYANHASTVTNAAIARPEH